MRRLLLALLGGLLAIATVANPASGSATNAGPSQLSRTSSVVEDVDSGAVYRLYRAYFNREPDAAGFWFWVDRLTDGSSLAAISDQFAESPEYIDTYGALDDAGFIDQAYTSVFGRPPDAGGREFWLGQMQAGTPRGEVMVAFSDSTEYKVRTGFVSQEAVERLYRAVFLRSADAGGLRFWLDQAAAGRSLIEISTAMVASEEFVGRYGSLDDADFVEQIYLNVLERGSDEGGGAFWRQQLGEGVPRGQIVWEFSASIEFQQSTLLFDAPFPAIPPRPGSAAPPVAPPILPTVLLGQPPFALFNAEGPCEFTASEPLIEPKNDTLMTLILRFNYEHLSNCQRSLGIPALIALGAERDAWSLVDSGYQIVRGRVYGYAGFDVPLSALDDESSLELEAFIYALDGRIEWSGPVNFPLSRDIAVSLPEEPLPFEQPSLVVPLDVTANPAAPNRTIGFHVNLSGSCTTPGTPSEKYTGWSFVGSGSGSFVYDLPLTIDVEEGVSCSLRVRTDDADEEVFHYIERYAPAGGTFVVAGDATCPDGLCQITVTTSLPHQWSYQDLRIRAIDGDYNPLNGFPFPFPRYNGAGPHSTTVNTFETNGYCIQIQTSYENLTPIVGDEQCYEPNVDQWVEAVSS